MTEKVKEKNCMYGYGFYIYASDDQLRRFIEKHRRTICELLDAEGRRVIEYLDSHPGDSFNPKEDLYDYAPELSYDSGIYGLVADVMCYESGKAFWYAASENEDRDDAVFFLLNNHKEKREIVEMYELEKICKEYIADLNDQLKTEYITAEYHG